jgi:hypothetical protein
MRYSGLPTPSKRLGQSRCKGCAMRCRGCAAGSRLCAGSTREKDRPRPFGGFGGTPGRGRSRPCREGTLRQGGERVSRHALALSDGTGGSGVSRYLVVMLNLLGQPFNAPCWGWLYCAMPPTNAPTPSGSQWLHEIKHDGFRVIARLMVTTCAVNRSRCARQRLKACYRAHRKGCASTSTSMRRTARLSSPMLVGSALRASCRGAATRSIVRAARRIGSRARTRTRQP